MTSAVEPARCQNHGGVVLVAAAGGQRVVLVMDQHGVDVAGVETRVAAGAGVRGCARRHPRAGGLRHSGFAAQPARVPGDPVPVPDGAVLPVWDPGSRAHRCVLHVVRQAVRHPCGEPVATASPHVSCCDKAAVLCRATLEGEVLWRVSRQRIDRGQAAELGRVLARYRAARGISQREFADRVYYDRTSVAHIEAGRQSAPRTFWARADVVLDAGGALGDSYDRALAAAGRPEPGLQPAGADSAESVQLVVRLLDLAGPSAALDSLDHLIADCVARYEQEGPHRLVGEVGQLLHVGQQIRTCRATRAEGVRLAGLTGRLCGLLAYMAVNRKRFDLSAAYCVEAAALATVAQDPDLGVWIKGTESFAAYYQHRYAEAVDHAREGQRLAVGSGQRIRLLINGEARALGKLGDNRGACRAVDLAFDALDQADVPNGMTPCISFAPYSWARTVANAATVYLSLGDTAAVLGCTEQLTAVLHTCDSDWSRSLVALDHATALAVGADVDEAATVGVTALAASQDKPITSVETRAAELATTLGRYETPATRQYRDALHEWRSASRKHTT